MVYKLGSDGFRLRCMRYFDLFSRGHSSRNFSLAVYPSYCHNSDNANIRRNAPLLFY